MTALQLAEEVIHTLAGREETLATAESLTGGLLGQLLTSVPGASSVYRGGLITYATDLKSRLAGVATETLDRYGAVAEQTAVEMALGCARTCLATWGLATTGVAGPDPQEGKPVGTVFVAVARPAAGGIAKLTEVRQLALPGTRLAIREHSAEGVLALLLESLPV